MFKKFTEEQFKKLVEIQEDQYSNSLFYRPASFDRPIIDAVNEFDDDLVNFIARNDLGNEAVALMNPLTRKWAHEQYVEKEKRYVWHLKNNKFYRLTNHRGATQVNISNSSESELTESEIREWGYDPECFDKEEVE